MRSIKTVLVTLISIIIVIAFGILTAVNYVNTEKTIKAELEKSIAATAQSNAKEISLWIDLRRTEIEGLANSPIIASGNQQAIVSYLAAESKRLTFFSAFWVADLYGIWYSPLGTTGSISERPYFKEILSTGKTVVSDPLIGKADGKMACVVAVPITVDGKTIGILGGNIKMDELIQHIGSITVGQTGYATLAQMDGLIIAHPVKDYIMQYNPLQDDGLNSRLREIYKQQSSGNTGVAHYAAGDANRYIAYAPIPGLKWTLNINAIVDEFTGPLRSLLFSSLMTTGMILIIAVFLILVAVKKITQPIALLQKAAENIAKGDLSTTDFTITTQNELGQLAKSFSDMVQNLRGLIRQVIETAEQVLAASEELAAGAEQSSRSVTQVADAISDVANGAEQQVKASDDTCGLTEQMSLQIEQATAIVCQATDYSIQAAKVSETGGQSVDEAVSQITAIEETVNNSAQVVAQLGEKSKEIGQIVDMISRIAGQTNLLALNAAIEAARAGKQGRGFTVVAEEVRKLAEQSQDAAKQIATLINEIQRETDKAVDAMAEGTREVKVGTEVVAAAGRAFKKINALITQVSEQARASTTDMQELTGASQQIAETVKEFDKQSKRAAGQVQKVSAATQEQSASIEEIVSASQNLAKLAQNLQTAVGKFRISSF
ncbi:methyl-accepting chemotaxis protein [Sporomusa acidovorans]|uniref:Methyl-accepting chemotaxis protein McpB n=1 Tax=Sporomusa acidovorans (strain ATCC 49682 / DSM 3132 / Mol) TaxID=1123286 RepID=A0ABZ3IYF2_SPOA4|nr:methyl-accepting chemotaxis protein [Sporomusa acidovorans]OZC16842.1 methyl-accepting chemotaxis protein McpB [Sporomusa acidovorans DSM 3132]SDF24185.1 methyl-accepting chemotaxis sensory transducer with Cache sensor [Sporomusa acidovorans]